MESLWFRASQPVVAPPLAASFAALLPGFDSYALEHTSEDVTVFSRDSCAILVGCYCHVLHVSLSAYSDFNPPADQRRSDPLDLELPPMAAKEACRRWLCKRGVSVDRSPSHRLPRLRAGVSLSATTPMILTLNVRYTDRLGHRTWNGVRRAMMVPR